MREGAHVRRDDRQPLAEGLEQHAALIDVSIGKHDDVRRLEAAVHLGLGNEAVPPADALPVPVAGDQRGEALRVRAIQAATRDHQLEALVESVERLEQQVDALVGGDGPEDSRRTAAPGFRAGGALRLGRGGARCDSSLMPCSITTIRPGSTAKRSIKAARMRCVWTTRRSGMRQIPR